MPTKTKYFILFAGCRKYAALCMILIALLLSCSTGPDRSRPYVYFPLLWDSWYLQEVWYYGENDSYRADGTGSLELESFGEKFGDEHYSLDFEVTVYLPDTTITITKTETGLFYAQLDDDDGNDDLYFFPDSGSDWHSSFYYYNLLQIQQIPVTGGTLWTHWDRVE